MRGFWGATAYLGSLMAMKSVARRRRSGIWTVVAACAVLAVSAKQSLACSWTHRPEPVGQPSGQFFASRMMDDAAFVDLVIAETVRPPALQPTASVATFRVLQRWKGNSPDRFTLQAAGEGDPDERAQDLYHWVDRQGRIYPHPTAWEMPAADAIALTSCDPGFIRPVPGRLYIVFRDRAGSLLGPVRLHDGDAPARAYPFVEVSGPRDWGWFDSVATASFQPAAALADGVVAATVSNRLTVAFQEPLTPTAATAFLRRTGLRPEAIRIVFGQFVDEVRTMPNLRTADVIQAAIRTAQDNLSHPGVGKAAQSWITDERAEALETDGWVRMHAVALILGEERRQQAGRAGPARIASVEIIGTEKEIIDLAKSPEVRGVYRGPPENEASLGSSISSQAPSWMELDRLARDRPADEIAAAFRRLIQSDPST